MESCDVLICSGIPSECGVGTIVYATTLAYDGARLEDGPKAITGLFDTEKYPGKRGLWKNPATNLEFALMADGVPAKEVYDTLSTPEGVDRAFAKLETIKDSIVWWEAGAQAPQLLASGEVVMTTAWNGRIHHANMEGKDFRIVWDNQILDSNFWGDPKRCEESGRLARFHPVRHQARCAGGNREIHPLWPGPEIGRRIRRPRRRQASAHEPGEPDGLADAGQCLLGR